MGNDVPMGRFLLDIFRRSYTLLPFAYDLVRKAAAYWCLVGDLFSVRNLHSLLFCDIVLVGFL